MTTATVAKNGFSPAEIDDAAEAIRLFIIGQGSATKDEIRAFCRDELNIPTPLYQKGFERADRQLNALTETSKDGFKSWAVKDLAKQHSLAELVAIAEGVSIPRKREQYLDWYQVAGKLILTSPALSSVPTDDPSKRDFVRAGDRVVLLSGYFRSMWMAATQKPGAPTIGSARYRVEWAQQVLSMPTEMLLRPVPPSRPGGSGQGVNQVATLPIGASVPFAALVPGSHIDRASFDRIMQIAGQWVGFSPAAAHLGYGRFTVEFDKGR